MAALFDDYTLTTEADVATATARVAQKAEEKGFDVLHIHDLGQIFGAKGFADQPVRVVEICFAAFGSRLLAADPVTSLMMPCKVAVYAKDGRTHISALRPRMVGDLFPKLAEMAEMGDAMMRAIVDEAR